VPTGRRDGLVSSVIDVQLPGPESPVSEALEIFNSKGMTMEEMVTLIGAHTVGFTHYSFIKRRIKNESFLMDSALRKKLLGFCVVKGDDPAVFLDQKTSFVFDNKFYNQVLLKRGLLTIDQNLALDSISKGVVTSLAANGENFREKFVGAIVKMGKIDVLVGNDGEIRKNCRVFNIPEKRYVHSYTLSPPLNFSHSLLSPPSALFIFFNLLQLLSSLLHINIF
jgi:peroxidase